METKKARGQIGQFWAVVDGKKYATIGSMRVTRTPRGLRYFEPRHGNTNGAKFLPMLEMLQASKMVVLTSETLNPETGNYERTGYIGLFEIDNIQYEPGRGLSFDLIVPRVCNLK
jgi:hypothetical protein